ncbi:MAG: DEAD/DEAH box helicase [Dermatophilaceae bacterium]
MKRPRQTEGRAIRESREGLDATGETTWRRPDAPRTETARPPADGPSFADLGLPEAITKTLAQKGIHHPFPIQQATIPDALAGRDVLGRGRTGSGKTLGFGLPMLARLSGGSARPDRPRALVLVPTRELALQVADALEPVSRALGLRQKVVAGGMPYPPQLTALERGLDVVVATPGRLQDLIDRGAAVLDEVEIVVLDEADHMADLGFLPEVTAIMDLVPPGGQRLLFSATLDRGIDELAERYLTDPVTHSTDEATAAVSTMEHTVLVIEPSMKKTLTARISGRPGKTLVFVRTQLGADRVAQQLRESGILAGALHGGLTQAVRSRVLDAFKDGRLDVLVATDVAARGIHVDDITLVVQVDPPADHKTYVHRAGRTARAGSGGSVITLALPHQRRAMERIIDEVALSIRPQRVDAAGERSAGPEPSGMPIPDEVWQGIVAPRPSRAIRGPRRTFRPRSDSGSRPRRRF